MNTCSALSIVVMNAKNSEVEVGLKLRTRWYSGPPRCFNTSLFCTHNHIVSLAQMCLKYSYSSMRRSRVH
jgi:hypothetical protein